MTVLTQILRDRLLWLVAAVVVTLLAVAVVFGPCAPQVDPKYPMTGRVLSKRDLAKDPDAVLRMVVDGTFPALAPDVTLGQAFAAYAWFTDKPKWLVRGAGPSRTVYVTAPLVLPSAPANLGVGSGAAAVFYVAEFSLSGDNAAFLPVSSAVEVRDGVNKLVARVPDPDFLLIRRVMRGHDPGVSLTTGVQKR